MPFCTESAWNHRRAMLIRHFAEFTALLSGSLFTGVAVYVSPWNIPPE